MMDKTQEQKRFNALSQEEAQAIASKYEGQSLAMRSCGYCNGAHDHLMKDFAFNCLWGCGITYLDGFPAPVIVRRARGEEISLTDMDDFAEALADGGGR